MTSSDSEIRHGIERRGGDRRQADQPFAGPDRRRGERRSGQDRRSAIQH